MAYKGLCPDAHRRFKPESSVNTWKTSVTWTLYTVMDLWIFMVLVYRLLIGGASFWFLYLDVRGIYSQQFAGGYVGNLPLFLLINKLNRTSCYSFGTAWRSRRYMGNSDNYSHMLSKDIMFLFPWTFQEKHLYILECSCSSFWLNGS